MHFCISIHKCLFHGNHHLLKYFRPSIWAHAPHDGFPRNLKNESTEMQWNEKERRKSLIYFPNFVDKNITKCEKSIIWPLFFSLSFVNSLSNLFRGNPGPMPSYGAFDSQKGDFVILPWKLGNCFTFSSRQSLGGHPSSLDSWRLLIWIDLAGAIKG